MLEASIPVCVVLAVELLSFQERDDAEVSRAVWGKSLACTSVLKKQVVLPIFTKWRSGILLGDHDSN